MPPTSKNATKKVGAIGFEAKLRLNAFKGRVSDPTFVSGPAPARFVQAEKSVKSHGGTALRDSAKPNREAPPRELRESKHHRGDISIYGQESNATTRRLAIMNLAICGIEADVGKD